MDNLRSHHVQSVREVFEAARVQFLYLPPYNPDLNPIEKMWSKLKAILRKWKIRSANLLPDSVSKALGMVTPSGIVCIGFTLARVGEIFEDCYRKLPGIEYVQVLVNRRDRKLVIRPSSDDMKDSFTWLSASGNPRTITCRLFYAMLVDMMGWNPNYRYKLIGKLVRSQTELILVFDLNATEIFRRELQKTETGEEKWRTSRKPVFPDEWKDQFGLPVEENQRVFQINIFDGYAVFGLKDKAARKPTDSDEGTEQTDENRLEGGTPDAT